MRHKVLIAIAACAALALAACTTGATKSPSTSTSPVPGAATSGATASAGSFLDTQITGTTGPSGETPTALSALTLTPAQIATLQGGHFKAAMLWHASSQFVTAVQDGATAEFQRLGIGVVATAQANMDAGKQANEIQTALVKKPNVILSLPVDPVSAAQAYQAAVSAGVKLVFLSNVPKGYTYGTDYASIVTDDLYQMGKRAAEALGTALGGSGTVGIIYYNASYYVTNQRDAAFKTTLEREFPNIKVVAQAGFTDATATESIASAMLTQHPNLSGIYVSYAQPAAEGVLAALRTINDKSTKMVTLDLDDPIVVDMATGGDTVAVVADEAWNLGKGMADAAAYALLGLQAPRFAIAGALTITSANIAQGYQDSLHSTVPSDIQKVMK